MKTIAGGDFALASCQATYFTPDDTPERPLLLKALSGPWPDTFDEEPLWFASNDMPSELPRVVLRSRSNHWRCEIARSRVNIHWIRPSTEDSTQTIEAFLLKAVDFLEDYIRALDVRVGRLATVVQRFALNDDAGLSLAHHFCDRRWHQAPLNRPQSFELHSHKAFRLAGEFIVNSWVRCKSGSLLKGEKQQPVILLEQDLNTLAEDSASRAFSSQERGRFFGAASKEFSTILDLYFPHEG